MVLKKFKLSHMILSEKKKGAVVDTQNNDEKETVRHSSYLRLGHQRPHDDDSHNIIDDNNNNKMGSVRRRPCPSPNDHQSARLEYLETLSISRSDCQAVTSLMDGTSIIRRHLQQQLSSSSPLQQQQAAYRYTNNNDGSSSATEYPTSDSTTYSSYTTTTATGVWTYMLGSALFLVCFVVSLILPKGLRKQVLGAQPRRYARRRYADMESIVGSGIVGGGDGDGDGTTTQQMSVWSAMGDENSSVDESVLLEVERRRLSEMSLAPSTVAPPTTSNNSGQRPPRSTASDSTNNTGSVYLRPMMTTRSSRGSSSRSSGTPPSRSFPRHNQYNNNNNLLRSPASPSMLGGVALLPPPASPGHPAIDRIPSTPILNETMQRLQTRGIRLIAHGVASESKRVWIKLEPPPPPPTSATNNNNHTDEWNVTWQTEFPRKIPNQSGEISLVMMRGALHKIALPNVLYVDVGKKTNALLKATNADLLETTCFSLLTQNGSLDLQAHSRLERDALVCCFSMVLDHVHGSHQDWRSLYAESPDTSTVGSGFVFHPPTGTATTTRHRKSPNPAVQSSAASIAGSADLTQVEF